MSREVSGSTFLLERLHLNRQLQVIPFPGGGGQKKIFYDWENEKLNNDSHA